MVSLIEGKQCVVVDFSFWQRQRRNEYKRAIEAAGGEWELVYLKVSPDELRDRLRIRSERFDANAAFTITEQILTSFLNGFETPSGEGEFVIEQLPLDGLRYPIGKFEPIDMSSEARAGFIAQIPDIVRALRRLTDSLTPEQLEMSYRTGGWSIKQIVHHMADNDMNAYLRFKRALTEDEPAGSTYREDLFAELSDYKDVPIERSLSLLEALHIRFHSLLLGLKEEHFQRKLKTQVLGTITLDIALQRFVWHNRHHTAQIEIATKQGTS
ncbi:YfiT family bacillithiol transferase [Paenibacillus sp. YIM B09110]|uniref:YfiT family bacillithiol transferase n=1 Tax=Paenibacillus sp. YIM B09110 TaxID=3126102 RepID=UPI00301E54D6